MTTNDHLNELDPRRYQKHWPIEARASTVTILRQRYLKSSWMLRVSLSRRHTPHLHLHNDDGTRRRKTDHPRPETKVVSAARGIVGGVRASGIPITREGGNMYLA